MSNRLHCLSAFAVYVALTCAVSAQQVPQGAWHGKISIGLQKLNIVFNFETDGSCTLDSPDQGAKGIAAELKLRTPDSVAMDVPSLQVQYRGRVEASRIVGKFKQGPYTFPLTLKPGAVDVRRPQTPRPPYPYRTEEVSISAGDAVLSATVTYPEGFDGTAAVPIAVMVSGSGLQNRDEEILQHRPFAVIADYLARNGVATLRYDDRGFGRSTGSNAEATTMTYADDAAAAVAFARSLGHFSRVGVLGHSEGGTIAFILGSRGVVDFAVSMAGAAECGKDILLRQNRSALHDAGVDEATAATYCEALASVLNGAAPHTDGLPDNLCANLDHISADLSPWLRHFAAYDPAVAISAVRCPVFAFNGSRDTQVDAETNLDIIRRLLPHDVKNMVREYEGLNHLMQHCTTGHVAEYGTIEETIATEVLEDIAVWINGL